MRRLLVSFVTVALFSLAFTVVVGVTSIAAAMPPLTGLQFWLDGQDLDGDGTPNALTPGDPVSLWKDRIGGLEFSQDVNTSQPIVSSINGVQSVTFNGIGSNDDGLSETNPTRLSGAAFLSDAQGTFVIVHEVPAGQEANEGSFFTSRKVTNAGAFNVMVLEAGTLGSTGALAFQNVVAPNNYIREGGPNILGTGARWSTISSNGVDDWAWSSNGAGWQAEKTLNPVGGPEGGWYDDVATYQSVSVGATVNTIGGTPSTGLTGAIGEILIYDHLLVASELDALGNYMNTKYGLPNTRTGDFNLDGNVTTADFDVMKANWLSTGKSFNQDGEVTGDGVVDIFDFKLFKEEIFPGGTSAFASAMASAVPEPSTVVLLLAVAPVCLLLRFRSRKKEA